MDGGQAVLQKLSVQLAHTYRNINEVWWRAKAAELQKTQAVQKKSKSSRTDMILLPVPEKGTVLGERWMVTELCGSGSYSYVVRAVVAGSTTPNSTVAIKMMRYPNTAHNGHYSSRAEMSILRELAAENKLQPADQPHRFLELRGSFSTFHKGWEYDCMVLDSFAMNLYELLKTRNKKGLPLSTVARIGRSVLVQLAGLESMNIVHTDVKPENVMLPSADDFEGCKLIDFGSAYRLPPTAPKEGWPKIRMYIQSRYYRAPEVLLRRPPFGPAVDMWSFGCLLWELRTGDPLFYGKNTFDQVDHISRRLGPLPTSLLYGPGSSTLNVLGYTPEHAFADLKKHMQSEDHLVWHQTFIRLLGTLIQPDPAKRSRASACLQHDFWKLAQGPTPTPPTSILQSKETVTIRLMLPPVPSTETLYPPVRVVRVAVSLHQNQHQPSLRVHSSVHHSALCRVVRWSVDPSANYLPFELIPPNVPLSVCGVKSDQLFVFVNDIILYSSRLLAPQCCNYLTTYAALECAPSHDVLQVIFETIGHHVPVSATRLISEYSYQDHWPHSMLLWPHARLVIRDYAPTPSTNLLSKWLEAGQVTSTDDCTVRHFRPNSDMANGLHERSWMQLNSSAAAFSCMNGDIVLVEQHPLRS